VRLDPGDVEVLVTEGRVGVERVAVASGALRQGQAAHAIAPSSAEAHVSAGQRATVSRTNTEPPQVVTVSPQTIARQLNWQPQLLDFSSAPLAVAVAEFNRRNRVQFVLADAELAAMPIVASIRSDNVEGFARFLAAAPGLEITRRDATEIVVHRKR
jgi:ferric-dicitrate binding protein FerR (iron transport regulator)